MRSETIHQPIPGLAVLVCFVHGPWRPVNVVVVDEFRDFAKGAGIKIYQVLDGAEVGIVAPVLENGEDFATLLLDGDEFVCFF